MAIGELQVGTLNDVYDMSWADFRIRLFAYKRMELKEWEKIRFLAYENLKSTQYVMNSKAKIPNSIDKYLPLYGTKKVDKTAFDILRKEQEKFKKEYRPNG